MTPEQQPDNQPEATLDVGQKEVMLEEARTNDESKNEPAQNEAPTAGAPVVAGNLPDTKKLLKWLAIGFGALVLVVILVIVLVNVFDNGGLAWDEGYGDFATEYATQTQVKLGIKVDDDEILDKLNVESSCDKNGQIAAAERNQKDIDWDLSDGLGKCTVKVKYKLKTIEKSFTMIPDIPEEKLLTMGEINEIDPNSDDDIDGDGLSNKEETKLKTDLELADTDMDGLTDGYEVGTLKTDPLKADTDDDGLDDYNEEKLELNPLKADSKGDGKKDGERELKFEYQNENGVKISVSGTGNIASTSASILEGAALSKKDGLVPKLYDFSTDGSLKSATVVIPYTLDELAAAGVDEDDLVLYYYDTATEKYEAVETIVDKNAKTVTVKLDHFSFYVLGDKDSGTHAKSDSEVMFVLDNSWSMYSNEQYKTITGEEYTGGIFDIDPQLDASDVEGRRFSLTSELVDKLSTKGMKLGLAEFRADYATAKKIGSSASDIKSTLDGMSGNFITHTAGTHIGDAIEGAASEFSQKADKTIVILTDGIDTGALSLDANSIAQEMSERKIRVCAIGFGEATYNSDLAMIAAMSGCGYFSSSDAGGLDEVFTKIEGQLNDELVDVDGDGKTDGLLLADSGFIVNRDGFSFGNYVTDQSEGHCFGMATFAQLFYAGKMPLKHDAIKVSSFDQSYKYDLSSSYFKNYTNLFGYKLQTNELKYAFGYDYFGEKKPADLYQLEGGVKVVADKYHKEIEQAGLYAFKTKTSKIEADEQIERYGFSYDKYETIELNTEAMQTNSKLNQTDKNVLNAIYAGFVRQKTVPAYGSGNSGTLWMRNLIGRENTVVKNANGFIRLLQARLASGEAPVIFGSISGTHAVNAISLVRADNNPDRYYIGVYDNNYPGELRYLDLFCSEESCTMEKNQQYDEAEGVLRITLSESEDLAFFENN